MPTIKQLSSHMSDLIAAGEVVERPASVVKELCENAIDAGARRLTVEIEHGGMTLIRVVDDGCGIPAAEAPTAFLRHATSKIREEQDLEAIGTLGFRGEALAAISAVARVELLTKTADAPLGTRLELDGGTVMDQEEAGCPDGTELVVRDLFYNTPARLKFMKRDSAEGAAVFACVQRLALSRPELAVEFLRDGKREMTTPGDGRLKSAVYAVLGRDLALGFTEVKGAWQDIGLAGFVSLPACCRGSRNYQHFFVNGRYIRSKVMMAALEEAYKNQRMVGKFPGCVLHLTVKPNWVDVNVHPAKTEVKFQSEQQVFSAVYHTVLAALSGDTPRVQANLFPEDPLAAGQTAMVLHSPTADPAQLVSPPKPVETPGQAGFQASPAKPAWKPAPTYHPAPRGSAAKREVQPRKSAAPFRRVTPLPPAPPVEERPRPAPAPPAPPVEPPPMEENAPAEETPWTLRGELFHTYVLVEQGDKITLIDKHAAHERANFDRLKAAGYQPMVQQLLSPVVFSPAPEERDALLAHTALLERFGFEVEQFGQRAVAVRAAPDYLDAGDIEGALVELARKLVLVGTADPAAARDELMHTMACKAAIKGGQRNGEEELLEVAKLVMSGQVRYCPHGRPVAVELTRKQLEKQFKRA